MLRCASYLNPPVGRILPVVSLVIILCAIPALGQRKKNSAQPPPQSEADKELAEARKDLVAKTNEYKDSLQKLIPYQQQVVTTSTETVEKMKKLLDQGVIAKRELDEKERSLADAQAKLEDTKRKLAESDNILVEAENMVRLPPLPAGGYHATAAMIRYAGTGSWSLKNAGLVESFFLTRFGHALPISAFGQSATHDHLGFDHRNAMDVAVHPDSPEGIALMDYLRKEGIPFNAFRHAIPGSATGAHIHIGSPSHRIGSPAAGM